MSEYVALPQDPFEIRPYGEYRVYNDRGDIFSYKDPIDGRDKLLRVNLEENTFSIIEETPFEEYKETNRFYKEIIKKPIDLNNRNEKKLYEEAKRLSRKFQNFMKGNYINCLLLWFEEQEIYEWQTTQFTQTFHRLFVSS